MAEYGSLLPARSTAARKPFCGDLYVLAFVTLFPSIAA